ncbi:MAG: ECF transporter S component [Anaerolineae bacterium]
MPDNNLRCLWQVNRKQVIIMLAGAVVYGLLAWLTNIAQLPNLLVVSLRPAVAIPIVCGLVWGPLVGLGVGGLGTLLADFLTPGASVTLYWAVGGSLLGLAPGLAMPAMQQYRTWRRYLLAEAAALAGVYLSLDYTVVRQVTYESLAPAVAWDGIFGPAFVSNSVNALILTPLLLWLYYRVFRSR